MLSVLRKVMLGVLAVVAYSCATTGEPSSDRSEMREPAVSRRQ